MNGKNTKTGERFPETGQWIVQGAAPGGDVLIQGSAPGGDVLIQGTAPGGDVLIHRGANMMKRFNGGDIAPLFENKDVAWQFIR